MDMESVLSRESTLLDCDQTYFLIVFHEFLTENMRPADALHLSHLQTVDQPAAGRSEPVSDCDFAPS
jgi:hypothetical protein